MARQVKARELTPAGIARARRFLDEVRQDPTGRKTPPRELIDGARHTRPFRGGRLVVEPRWHAFKSRRKVGEYLAPRLAPFRTWIADRMSFWSWLGIFHFEDTVRIVDGAARLSPLDETFVIDRADHQNLRGSHRHCLRSAWQLHEVHGENAAFLLDQPPWARGDIADRILQSQRIFNSTGLVPLILGLYTDGTRPKRGFQGRPGGLRHLLRVLDQLERTHDVYGMFPDALAGILPVEFDPWVNGAGLAADETGETDSESMEDGQSADLAGDGTTEEAADSRLEQWERIARRHGHGTMRYKRFRAEVRVDPAEGLLTGRIIGPDAHPIATVSAADAIGLVDAIRTRVNEFRQRGRIG